jgi:outer membrane protein OmpA-like peptidoglycan-associated protein
MSNNSISKQKIASVLMMLIIISLNGFSQTVKRTIPKWWFGISGAANKNYYEGTTQLLNSSLTVPAAFHKGSSIRPYGSFLAEYRPNRVFGIMLNTAFDNRGGKFDKELAPCNCLTNLSTSLSYFAIEPSIRLTPFKSSFYIYGGPTLGININKEFKYTQEKQSDVYADWGNINKNVVSAQFGLGFDIPVSGKVRETQMTLSPYASFQSNLFKSPRSIESWTIYSVRVGVALKIGTARRKLVPVKPTIIMLPAVITEKEIQFSVRAPKLVPQNRQVKETFPLRNSVFFDMGELTISNRYIQLNKSEAKAFKEEQLQQGQPTNLNSGRSKRQLYVYHQILNILGDRMRKHPQSKITLIGSSDKNPKEGMYLAEQIKTYLTGIFNIEPNRITTVGRDKPVIPSEQPGAINELELLHEGDRRVDIESNSSDLFLQVGGADVKYLKPIEINLIQEDPLDSYVLFNAKDEDHILEYWNIRITDEQFKTQLYGPFYNEEASIPGNQILGDNQRGNYTIVMIGKTKSGREVIKNSSVSLLKSEVIKQTGLRYSILFDFDKSKTIKSYENFLNSIIEPLIADNAIVTIHGYTDIIGDEIYNFSLSKERAIGVQEILKAALIKTNKKGVKFETYGFGENLGMSPFENKTPEERFYNRTVIIDIVSPE